MTTTDILVECITFSGTYILSPIFIIWMIVVFFFSGHNKH